jgi:hypothetical protein
MISKENFVTLIESNRRFFAYVMKLSNEMNIELWENPLVMEYDKVFMNYIKEFFTKEEDIEWIEWFCYDKFYNLPNGKIEQAWDDDGNEICKTTEDLYDYLIKDKDNGELYSKELD